MDFNLISFGESLRKTRYKLGFTLDQVSELSGVNSVEPNDEIYPKLCHNLAGVYRRNGEFEKALNFSNIGIDACQKTGIFNGLNILYYGKGIAEYKLNKDEYIKSLEMSIALCEAFGQKELKDKIISNCREVFNIKL